MLCLLNCVASLQIVKVDLLKIIFTSFGAITHLALLMPLAHAFSHAGHQVCIATHGHEREFLNGAGLPYFVVSPELDVTELMKLDTAAKVDPFAPEPETKSRRSSEAMLTDDDTAGTIAGKLNIFGLLISGHMTDDEFTGNLTAFAKDWQPDVIVWDSMSYGCSVAASVTGALSVRSLFAIDQFAILRERYIDLVGSEDPSSRRLRQGDPLSSWLRNQAIRLGGEIDLDEHDLKRLVYGDVTLNPLPDGTQPEARYERMDVALPSFFGGEILGATWAARNPDGRPRVCVTIGISSRRYNLDLPPLAPLLDALEDVNVDVIVTIGVKEAHEFGLFREGFTYVERVSLEALLPNIDLVIHHFGTGTLLSAYRNAVPQLHLEAPSDIWGERQLSEALHQTGHVWTVDFANATRESLGVTLREILTDQTTRKRAEASRDVYLSRQTMSETVAKLVDIVAAKENESNSNTRTNHVVPVSQEGGTL